MYLEACIQQRQQFSPFFASVDGILGVEASATPKRIATRLATKWRKQYYRTRGYVNIRIATTLMRATHWCIRDSRVLAHKISVHRLQWEDSSGINLFRSLRRDIPRPSEASTLTKYLIYIGADGLIRNMYLN